MRSGVDRQRRPPPESKCDEAKWDEQDKITHAPSRQKCQPNNAAFPAEMKQRTD